MSAEAQARASAHAEAMLVDLELTEVRRARGRTQVDVAHAINRAQASASKLERRDDMYLSTLHASVQAPGGELKPIVSFPDADIQIRRERRPRS